MAGSEAPSWWQVVTEVKRTLLRYVATSPLASVSSPDSGVEWIVTGVGSRLYNGVVGIRHCNDIDATIASAVSALAACRAPAVWYTTGENDPPDLLERLTSAGLRRGQRLVQVMGAGVDDILVPPVPRGLRIREATRASHLDEWYDVAARVWREAPADQPGGGFAAQHARLHASLKLGRRALWRHWVAYEGRRPVGMVSAAVTTDGMFIEHLGVLQAERGRGIGTALMGTPISRAQNKGCRWVVVEPNHRAAELCRDLGFADEEAVDDDLFYYDP